MIANIRNCFGSYTIFVLATLLFAIHNTFITPKNTDQPILVIHCITPQIFVFSRPVLFMKKVFFISDFHFGIPGVESSKEREMLFLKWLKEYKALMSELYVVGDLFDFWFEYKNVVPKGGVRILAALADLQDSGIPVTFFSGNHDQWMFDYFEKELGINVHHDPIERNILSKKFLIGHGDGMGPGDQGYKFIKKIFRNSVSRFLFSIIPPGLGIRIAHFWSGRSRIKGIKENVFLGADTEWLIQYCETEIKKRKESKIDYFVFGHRHIPIHWKLSNGSYYINLGDWLKYHSFTCFDGEKMECLFYGQSGYSFIENDQE